MVEDGLELEQALHRTAGKLGITLQHAPPIDSLRNAIRDYRELFRPEQLTRLHEQRRQALRAMSEFSAFQPRLFGSLLHGDGPLDRIRLLLSADTPEQVMHHLADRHIPWREAELLFPYSGRRKKSQPALRFMAGDAMIELVVAPLQSHSDPPLDALTGKRLETLGMHELSALIETDRP